MKKFVLAAVLATGMASGASAQTAAAPALGGLSVAPTVAMVAMTLVAVAVGAAAKSTNTSGTN